MLFLVHIIEIVMIVTFIHSYWAYLVLLTLSISFSNAIIKKYCKKVVFTAKDFRLALFALITLHIQLLIGLINYFTSEYFLYWNSLGFGGVMKDSVARKLLVEHPLVALLSVVLVTIGWSKHKKVPLSRKKFSYIALFYGLGLLLLLSRIPWSLWFS